MTRYSLLLAQRNAASSVQRTIAALLPVLEQLDAGFELLVIDAGSSEERLAELQAVCEAVPEARLLKCPLATSASIATAVGIGAAFGEILICVDPAGEFEPVQLLAFIAQLTRADAVFGKRTKRGIAKLWERIMRVPRWLLLGLDVRDLGCRLWAARREAVRGLESSRGLLRSMADLISLRGFRVCEIPCDYRPTAQTLSDDWPNPGDLLSLWWRRKRHVLLTAKEVPLHSLRPGSMNYTSPLKSDEQNVSAFLSSARRRSA